MAQDIYSTLRGRFPENEYVLMREVSDGAGFDRSRSADYIAVNLFPSRGLSIHGIELKSFRGDWLNELKNPKKAENIFQYCDYFWLLTQDEKIAKIEEIPPTWGWLNIKGDRIYTKKKAPVLKPKHITKSFMCAMLKRASDKRGYVLRDSIKEEVDRAFTQGGEHSSQEITRMKNKLNEIEKNVHEFEKASGIGLCELSSDHFWRDPKKMGEAFKFVNEQGGTQKIREKLMGLEEAAKNILENISSGLKSLPQ